MTLRLKRIPVKKTVKNIKRGISSFFKKSVRLGKKATRKVRNVSRRVSRRVTFRR